MVISGDNVSAEFESSGLKLEKLADVSIYRQYCLLILIVK